MRILLIEDNEDHAVLCQLALAGAHQVRVATTLTAGLLLLAAEDFDAILSDLTLPDGAGVEVARRIRRTAPSTPLLALTCQDSDGIETAIIDEGAQDFLVKSQVFSHPGTTRSAVQRALHHAVLRQQSIDEKERLVGELRESQRELQQKNEQLAEMCNTAQTFVDNVSHEFRTPLTVIREYASLIRDEVVGVVNKQQVEMLDVIEDRSDDLNTMVDDMLDVSRLEAGIVSVRRKACSLAQVFERTMPPLLRKAEVRNIELSYETPDRLPDIWADAEKLSRVLINLVVNAIKFCGQPGEVHVRAEYDPVAGEVLVTVRDNGPGISAEQCELIYERFAQPVVAVRQSTKGFGLGLGIAKDLVDLNLGHMTLQSVEGEGSTFGFTVLTADPRRVLQRHLRRLSRMESPGKVRLLELTANPADDRERQDLETLIEQQLFRNDQLFDLGGGRWAVVMSAPGFDRSPFETLLAAAQGRQNRNRPRGAMQPLLVRCVGVWQRNEANESSVVSAFLALLNESTDEPATKTEPELSHA